MTTNQKVRARVRRGSLSTLGLMLAPALAAATAFSPISSGVTGRCGDMLGVWIEPVTAQVMMTLREPMLRVLSGARFLNAVAVMPRIQSCEHGARLPRIARRNGDRSPIALIL